VGKVEFGSLERLTPVSRWFGYERGQPVDRYYIEKFLAVHRGDVRGRVLEAGDRGYTTRYGQSAVTRSDVLNLLPSSSQTTIVAN
jgi:hypothetical protein